MKQFKNVLRAGAVVLAAMLVAFVLITAWFCYNTPTNRRAWMKDCTSHGLSEGYCAQQWDAAYPASLN